MKHLNFEETNMPLLAGDNPNTNHMRVCLATHPEYNVEDKEGKPQPVLFYISKWEMTDEEKKLQEEKIVSAFNKEFEHTPESELTPSAIARFVLDNIAPVYLTIMHGPPPVLLLQGMTPFQLGYKPVRMNNPIDN